MICRYSALPQAQKVCIVAETIVRQTAGMDAATHKVKVGERLRIAIEAIGASQAAVCRQLKVQPSKLGNWLRGENYPDPYFIQRFCDRYGVTADWIYRGVASGVAGSLGDALWTRGQASGVVATEGADQASEKKA